MALKLKISAEEWSALDEAIKALYSENGNEYVLSVDGIEDTSGLKSALDKERKARADFEKMAKKFGDIGMTPEEIAELVKKQEEAERQKMESKGEWDKLKVQLLESHKKETDELKTELSTLKDEYESSIIEREAISAISSAKGFTQLLLPHVKMRIRAVKEDNRYHVRVIDKDGVPRMNSKGEFLSVSDLVAEMRESEIFRHGFDGTGTSGSGVPSNATGVRVPNSQVEWQKMSAQQRVEMARAAGLKAT